MIVRINRDKPLEGTHDTYHFYQCDKVTVKVDKIHLSGGLKEVSLLMDECKAESHNHKEAMFCDGDTAYIMNDDGKTIDIIRTSK